MKSARTARGPRALEIGRDWVATGEITRSVYVGRARSKRTLYMYAYYQRWLREFCERAGREHLPVDVPVLLAFFGSLGRYRVNTIAIILSAISAYHRDAGVSDPTRHRDVRDFMDGRRRSEDGRPTEPISLEIHLKPMLAQLDPKDRLQARCGAATTLMAVTGLAIRHISALKRNVVFNDGFMTIQSGPPWRREIVVHAGDDAVTCPVRWMRAWLRLAAAGDGPLFHNEFNPAKPINRYGIYEPTRAAYERAGVSPVIGCRPLRRAFALKLDGKFSRIAIAEQMAYKSLGTLEKGQHLPGSTDNHHKKILRRRGGRG